MDRRRPIFRRVKCQHRIDWYETHTHTCTHVAWRRKSDLSNLTMLFCLFSSSLSGNKCDLVDAKVIDTAQGQAVARDFGIDFYEASAKTDHNVQEAFNGLVNQVCERVISGNAKKKAPGASGSGASEAGNRSVEVNDAGAGEKKKCC